MLKELLEMVVVKIMKFDKEHDLTLLESTNENALLKVKFNDVDCGLLMLTTDCDLNRKAIILSNTIKNTIFDFFILMNVDNIIVMFTDHQGNLFPQHISTKNENMVELVCSKPFLKNLIANRGVEYL